MFPVAAALAAVVAFAAPAGSAEKGAMRRHAGPFAKVLEEAKAAGKPVLVDFFTDWCPPCKYMEAQVFTEPGVAAFSNEHFVFFSVDAEKGEGVELAKKHGIEGYPTFVFLGPDGALLEKSVGGRPAPTFLAMMKEVAAGHHATGLRRRLDADADDGEAHARLGLKLVRDQDLFAAKRHLDRSIALDPEAKKPWAPLARFWRAAAEAQETNAVAPLEKFAATFPDSAEAVEAHRWLATYHEQKGDAERTLASMEFILAREPDAAVRHGVAWLLAKRGKDLERALGLVDAALKDRPKEAAFHDTRAECLSRLEKPAEAVAASRKALELSAPRDRKEYERRLEEFEAKAKPAPAPEK